MKEDILKKIVEKEKTPLYIYDFSYVRNNIHKLQQSLPDSVELFYSVKANPNESLLKEINQYISGMEVASLGELEKAIKAKVSPMDIIFVGPGKNYDELEFAVKSGIFCIVIESVKEAEVLNEICKRYKKNQFIAVRINTLDGNKSAKLKMGGGSKPFGIDEEIILDAINDIENFNNLLLGGIYTYSGTQILNHIHVIKNFENTFKIALKVQEHLKRSIEFIGFGGGYGVPYFESNESLDLDKLKYEIKNLFNEYEGRFTTNIRYISESGRYLVAECGTYVVKVLYVKKSRGTKYIIVDGGTNFYSIASGMGKFLRRNMPVNVLKPKLKENEEEVIIVGPLCTPTDILSQNVTLPRIYEGDYIIYPKAGAYGYTTSPKDFLSHKYPKELIYNCFIDSMVY